ncbi:hypothetical protein GTZ78_01315, partial [Streptomyces sp. SID8361]
MIEHRERAEGRDVVAELRAAAASHEPDRSRMLARVTAGIAADDRRRNRAPRMGPRRSRMVGPVAGLA